MGLRIYLSGRPYDENNPLYTPTGRIRLRWWLLVLFSPLIAYGLLNFFVVIMVMAGAKGVSDPLWHAPAIWFFELLVGK